MNRVLPEPVPPRGVNRDILDAPPSPGSTAQTGRRTARLGIKNTMKITPKIGLFAVGLAVAASLTGCVAVVAGAAGAGTVAYVSGGLDASLNSNYEKTVAASDLAIQQLEFAKVSEKKDALTAYFTARTAADRKVTIKVIKIADQATQVEIRVGFFGDKLLSMTILDKIKANV